MKSLVVLLGLVAFCASAEVLEELLQNPGDNSHYVEGKSRYIWMSDSEGKPTLVDLHEPVDEERVDRNAGSRNQYWLFTRRNPTNRQVLVSGNANSIWSSHYLGSRPIKVVVHGWNNNGNTLNQIRSAFLDTSDCNVIMVDWSGPANGNYNNAVRDVPSVGQHLGNFLVWLINTGGGNWNQVHLVGFSLGAHVVGNGGRQTGRRPRRITGLDPAGPSWGGNANALNRNDGGYVESIHTDGRKLGIFDPISDADFYPNGGRHPQPGCNDSTCSHGRAPELFASTVRFNRLVGRRCVNTAEAQLATCNGAALNMGNNAMTKSGTGIYGLLTGRAWPF